MIINLSEDESYEYAENNAVKKYILNPNSSFYEGNSFTTTSTEFRSMSNIQSSTRNEAVKNIASDLLRLNSNLSLASNSENYSSSEYSSTYLSKIESAILRSINPVEINEADEIITVFGNRGIWINRDEVNSWKGPIPINDYIINDDSNPEIITKKVSQSIEYIQELAIRYLRPPTPPAPGEIIIKQEANIPTAPAPPLIIRQQPARPLTPEPLVIREAPPQPPVTIGRKIITISGKRIPPPPRKVVIERLPQLPSKPQAVLIERWLPYAELKRKVVFQPNQVPDPVVIKPRNIIIQWESPDVVIKKEVKYLGVIRADPSAYVSRYGSSLKLSNQLPQFVQDIKTPDGLILAANYVRNKVHELEGDLHALSLIDLDREGLSEYKNKIKRTEFEISSKKSSTSLQLNNLTESNISRIIEQIFREIDYENTGFITVNEAERILLKLNSRLGRSYGEDDVELFFSTLDVNSDNKLSLDEFRRAFLNFL